MSLTVENLSVSISTDRDHLQIVGNVSFTIEPGEVLGLIGESGSGKSMTALAISGLLPAEAEASGVVNLDGVDLLSLKGAAFRASRVNGVAIIFQEPLTSLDPLFPIGSQIVERLRYHFGLSKKDAASKAVKLLDMVGMPNAQQRMAAYPYQLSGGMRQRVMIAMALALEPRVLIADEPTTALDVIVQAEVIERIRRLQEDSDVAILFITHDLALISAIAQRVAVMYAGEIVEIGTKDAVFSSPTHPYTEALVECASTTGDTSGRLVTIEGSVPDPARIPSGCRFEPRCRYATPRCQAHPVLEQDADAEHWFRCFHPRLRNS